jgi:hypothetical protein
MTANSNLCRGCSFDLRQGIAGIHAHQVYPARPAAFPPLSHGGNAAQTDLSVVTHATVQVYGDANKGGVMAVGLIHINVGLSDSLHRRVAPASSKWKLS